MPSILKFQTHNETLICNRLLVFTLKPHIWVFCLKTNNACLGTVTVETSIKHFNILCVLFQNMIISKYKKSIDKSFHFFRFQEPCCIVFFNGLCIFSFTIGLSFLCPNKTQHFIGVLKCRIINTITTPDSVKFIVSLSWSLLLCVKSV